MNTEADVTTLRRQALVVEDEPVIARVCQRTLTAHGFDVDHATTGTIAMAMVDKNSYDIILSDIRTPGMNGIQFRHYLTERHPEMARRIIFTTGDIMSREVAAFLEELRTPWLPKPFTPVDLLSVVSKALGQHL